MSQYLYRHFDKDNVLLYIGISYNALARLNQHKSKAYWFKDIANVTIEQFETRKGVEEAELQAIRLEKPKHNIQGVLHTTPEGIVLKWKKPKYLIKGKRLLPRHLVTLYLNILEALEPDKTWYNLVVSYKDLKALQNIISFSFCKGGSQGSLGIVTSIITDGLLTKKVEMWESARDMLIQARDTGDTFVDKEYEYRDNLYSSSWYI